MSFELCREEPFAENVARLARERLDETLSALLADGSGPGGEDGPGADAVHSSRKNLKKLRALLRLARPGLGEATFSHENTALRDAGRVLSDVRDAQVLVPAFDTLRRETVGRVAPETIEAIHRQLLDAAKATETASIAQGNLAAAAETLRQVRDRVAGWSLVHPDRWRVPGRGLKTVYRRGRRAMHRADTAAPAEEDFHEWRKQVKYLAAHVRLLRPLRPKKLGKLAKTLDRIADRLGDEHDLSVLQTRLAEPSGAWASAHELAVITEAIEAHRWTLQAEALDLGREVYAQEPGRFRRRFKRYWKTWRQGK